MIAAGSARRDAAGDFQLYRSRFGELLVATRDAEERVRFLGHDPANIKLVAYVVAAIMASIGGALFVPIGGTHHPPGGRRAGLDHADRRRRARAAGPRCSAPRSGRWCVGYGRTSLSESFPDQWTYFLGALFIVVILLHPARADLGRPQAVAAVPRQTRSRRRRQEARRMTEHDHLEIRELGVELRRLQGRRRRRPAASPGTTALPDRAQRRRQDDARRRAHRSGQGHRARAVRRQGPAGAEVAPDRARGRGAHLPDRDRLRGAHASCRTSTSPAASTGPRGAWCCARRKVPAYVEEALETVGLQRPAAPPGRASSRTARSSGSRSACCWSRTRR